MIVDFIQHQGLILAINDLGHLLVWNIARYHLHSQCYLFPQNVSIVPSQIVLTLSHNTLAGIFTVASKLTIYSHNHILTLPLTKLLSQTQQIQPTDFKDINLSGILESFQEITYLTAVDSESIVIATSRGNLIIYNLNEEVVVEKSCFWGQIKKNKEEGLLATSYEPIPQVTCITCFKNGNLGLVSLDNGKIYSVEMNQLKVLDEITSSLNSKLQKITKLYLSQKEHKVYSLHLNYIVQWNYQLFSCLSYIQYPSPRCLTKQGNSFAVVGMHPALTLIDRQAFGSSEENSKQLQLSMRGALVVKQLGGQLLGVGGTDNLVDIFINHSRLMTLIHK